MPYIGKQPTVGNFQVCDAISVVNGQAAYTMQVGGSNVEPENANHMLVSLNGVLQKPGSSFTISGSTITFASNLATGDVIDFITLLGDTLNTGAPSDDTVTAAKLNNDIISGQTALTAEPDDTDEFLVSDAGTIKRIDYSLIKGGGITEADLYRHTTSLTISSETTVTAWERPDDQSNSTNTFAYIGTGMSHSSGTFTFPSTGIYLVRFIAKLQWVDTNAFYGRIYGTKNNSSYDKIASADSYGVGGYNNTVVTETFFDVTDVSNDKIQFRAGESSNCNLLGNTDFNQTVATFIRLGDT